MKALTYNPTGIDQNGTIKIKCPAGHTHHINTQAPNSSGAIWGFNGDFEKPTFTPSINEHVGKYVAGFENIDDEYGISYICHFIVTDGKIYFCGDCTHEFVNQTMDLLDID